GLESNNLGVLLTGRRYEGVDGKENYSFWDLKGVLEDLFAALPVTVSFEPGGPEFLHPGRKANINLSGESVGYAGELGPERTEDYELPDRTYLAELDFETIIKETDFESEYEKLPRYPASKRDLSLTVPEEITEREIRGVISGEPRVEDLYLYDLYQGDQIEAGRRSLTYEITFRDDDKTLSDEEVDEIVAGIKDELASKGIALRE
ncbi:phenylalanine--tRNA ligase subunit beta, partial [Candidatus Bipolaricaulota bacterium]|nr:phenylalanine--tRNA ligase subunit beta [Candidatus Bipolaricaulota bacterium]